MISNLIASSGKPYGTGRLIRGDHQYMDRLYQFDYVPAALNGCPHIKPHGDDKMLHERKVCMSFVANSRVELYVLYPDIQPVLPRWLEEYERVRMNVTRIDSIPGNLKGYFSLYRRRFEPGPVTLYGNSPEGMLKQDWYVQTGGANYCMYSVALKEAE